MRPSPRPPARQQGFTLLALLFAVALLGVGMAGLGTMWHTSLQREKEQELLFVGDQFRKAIESFWNNPPPGQQKRLPSNLAELVLDPRFPGNVRHLRRLYLDPMSWTPEWGLEKDGGGGVIGVYSRSEGRPMKASGFAPAYESFAGATQYRGWVFRALITGSQGKAAQSGDDADATSQVGLGQGEGATTRVGEAEKGQPVSREALVNCVGQRSAELADCRKQGASVQAFNECRNQAIRKYFDCVAAP
ncbi:MAG: prepilin-type N-terminal cleavage/methylation domain-containing protein [Pseudomonadota bacterium]